MNLRTVLTLTILCAFLSSCGNSKKSKKKSFSLEISYNSENLHKNDSLTLAVENSSEKQIDSVEYYYAGNYLKTSSSPSATIVKLKKPLGQRPLTAKVYHSGKVVELTKNIILHSNQAVAVYTYKIINQYPHDPHAFTQGLEFYHDTLYEGTGRHGVSVLRKVNFKTGEVYQEVDLARKYFGEGITIMNGKVYQLTWKAGVGFVYDANNLKKLSTFHYKKSKEGWGLCNNGELIFKSDGTNKIWVLEPETLEELYYIEPVTQKDLATRVNEIEWVNGKIYANTWQKEGVLIINPKTGAVEGIIDFRGLKDHLGNKAKANVLNGIAYNQNTGKLYVTGKNWDSLFEVEIIKK